MVAEVAAQARAKLPHALLHHRFVEHAASVLNVPNTGATDHLDHGWWQKDKIAAAYYVLSPHSSPNLLLRTKIHSKHGPIYKPILTTDGYYDSALDESPFPDKFNAWKSAVRMILADQAPYPPGLDFRTLVTLTAILCFNPENHENPSPNQNPPLIDLSPTR
ncbi:MAG: hypothetical protein WCP45_16645 [Verrucomicrobiota bacterium]